jgi:hypothetical protein
MWSMTTFLAAFSSLVLDRSQTKARVTFGIVLLGVLMLTFWSVYDTWTGEEWFMKIIKAPYTYYTQDHDQKTMYTQSTASSTDDTTPAVLAPVVVAVPAGSANPRTASTSLWRKLIPARLRPSSAVQSIPMHIQSTRPTQTSGAASLNGNA